MVDLANRKYRHFNYAYEFWAGDKWEWTNKDGTPNHPMDSDDATIKAFYTGFTLARKGQKLLIEKTQELERIRVKLNEIERHVNAYSKDVCL